MPVLTYGAYRCVFVISILAFGSHRAKEGACCIAAVPVIALVAGFLEFSSIAFAVTGIAKSCSLSFSQNFVASLDLHLARELSQDLDRT